MQTRFVWRMRRSVSKSVTASFRVGDAVRFIAHGDSREGVIVRMHAKRANVRSGDVMWAVPYVRLRTATQ